MAATPPEAMSPGRRRLAALVAVAAVVTALNVPKPLAVDDAVNYLFAAHIAEHPLDPYGFTPYGQRANSILLPPAFMYWWAAGVRLFGTDVPLWKLWGFPANLLFVLALHAVGRRFARGMELPLVCAVALSGAVLPCVNMMLDVPALALALSALVLFFRACDRDSWGWAAAAGAVAGVAIQTKYTAFVAPGAMLAFAWHAGRLRLGVAAGAVAAGLFLGWEALMDAKYGDSHFWLGYKQFRVPLWKKINLLQPLFGTLGGVIPAGLPLALAALRRPAWVVWTAVAFVAAAFAFIAFPDGPALNFLRDRLGVYPNPKLIGILFGVVGVGFLWTIGVVAWNLLDRPRAADGLPAPARWRSVDAFLVVWLALEVAGYFLLSPYPAARRVMGVVVVAVLLACRLAAQRCGDRKGTVWAVVGFGTLLGLLMTAVDFNWHYGQQRLAVDAAAECRAEARGADVWYFGNGAFEFAADRLGMRRTALPGSDPRPGDRMLVVEEFQPEFSRHPVSARCDPVGAREWRPTLPLRSEYQYGSAVATRSDGPFARVTVYRVR